MAYKPRSQMTPEELEHSRARVRENTRRNRKPRTDRDRERDIRKRASWSDEKKEQERQRLAALPKTISPARRARMYAQQRERKTGFSATEFEAQLREQNGRCFICGNGPTKGKSLAADHCHKTGKPRRLLCYACNAGVGMFKDNPALLRLAAAYLDNFRAAPSSFFGALLKSLERL